MRIVRTIPGVRAEVAQARAGGRTVALVPTMGAFHAGHEALMRAAGDTSDLVVVSLFVNPTQFDQAADLAAYPRVEGEDAVTAERAGAHVLFAPSVEEMYPAGFATAVSVSGISEVLEGAHRPGHFTGVGTVVTKLLNIVAPDVAWFGAKDAQQLLVVRRLVADLDLPVRIEALDTVRESDGLALSSRNRRLSPAEREQARALPEALAAAAAVVLAGERDPHAVATLALAASADRIRLEYLAVVDPDTLATPPSIEGEVLIAAAAHVGSTRLIDNVRAAPPARASSSVSAREEIA